MKTREETVEALGGNPYIDEVVVDVTELDQNDRLLMVAQKFNGYVWPNKNSGWFNSITFNGKATKGKPVRHPSYKSAVDYVQKSAMDILKRAKVVEDEKFQRVTYRNNLVRSIKPGDILYSSWGYDQTNVCFYQVVTKVKTKFVIREIMGSSEYDSSGNSGTTWPVKDSFLSSEITVGVNGNGFKISDVEHAKPLEFTFDEKGNRVYNGKQFSKNR